MARKALVIGIGNYSEPNALISPTNNADAIAQLLHRNEGGDVNFHVNKQTTVDTKAQLRELIHDFFRNENATSEISLFYYSGHGYFDKYGGFLVTPDCERYDMGVSMQDLLSMVNSSKDLSKVVILDCCNSGQFGISQAHQENHCVIGGDVTILTSSQRNEIAIANAGYGIFTSLLIAALKGGAADITGHITTAGVYAYIDKYLSPNEQRPMFKTNVSRFTSLRIVRPHVGNDILRKITTYFTSPNMCYPLDPSFEDTEPNAIPKNTAIFKDLQKYVRLGLLLPCDEEHMYYAAINSKSCMLTQIGQYYWHLVDKGMV